MASDADPEIADFIHLHRVHFDVAPEVTFRGSERLTVGYLIRLWAVHEKGARVLPGCHACRDLAAWLQRIATVVTPHELRPTQSEVEPLEPALYDSREVPGTDEVAITIRLFHRGEYAAPVDACEDRCLREIRAGLKRLGARER